MTLLAINTVNKMITKACPLKTVSASYLIALILLLSSSFPSLLIADEQVTEEVIIETQGRGGDFSLIGENGWTNLSDFQGKVVALYFGYTKCPDVCPTNLSFLSSAIAQLSKEEKQNFQSIFVSVDPGRDSVAVLAKYVAYFDEEMIGLSAAPDDLDPVVVQYGAYYEKVPYSNSALMYGIDHTSETYIIGKDGKLFKILHHTTEAKNSANHPRSHAAISWLLIALTTGFLS